jgi:hypothetical protein
VTAPRRVRIGRLILDGIEPAQRDAIVASFHDELTQLLTAYPHRLPDRPRPARGASADEIGRQAAAAVHARVIAAC